MVPVFAPEHVLRHMIEKHGVSERVFRVAQSARRYYTVDAPPRIGILNQHKRCQAFLDIMWGMDKVRVGEGFSDEETAMMLLNVVTGVSKCYKAMAGFHFEYHTETGVGAMLPSWMSVLGYPNTFQELGMGHSAQPQRSYSEHVQSNPTGSSSSRTREDADETAETSGPDPQEGSGQAHQEPGRFSDICELIMLQMAGATMLTGNRIEGMNADEQQRYLAFELGVIEYYLRVLELSDQADANSAADLLDLLEAYSKTRYEENHFKIYLAWNQMATQQLNLRERKLGYDSVRDARLPDGSPKPGHFAGLYLNRAMGWFQEED